MDITSILIFLAIGAVAGWLAGVLMKGGGFGLLGNIVVGIIGRRRRGALRGAWPLGSGLDRLNCHRDPRRGGLVAPHWADQEEHLIRSRGEREKLTAEAFGKRQGARRPNSRQTRMMEKWPQ
jgi:uncharacterized membrane protein YeaQ/YmgE (transglycosylase-associated protein family)